MKNINKIFAKSIVIILCVVFLLGVMNSCVSATVDGTKAKSVEQEPNQVSVEETAGIIKIKYVDKEGNSISEEETRQGNVGEAYEIARKNIAGYKAYGVTPQEAKGTYAQEQIEVVFVYQKIKSEEVVIKYIDKDGNNIRRDKTIIGNAGESYETQAAEVDGYKASKTDGEEKGQIKEEAQEITYTYKKVDKDSKKEEWTVEKTLFVIAIAVVALIIIFIIIAKLEKKNKKENIEEKNNDKKEEKADKE